jgi:hypothetical protein
MSQRGKEGKGKALPQSKRERLPENKAKIETESGSPRESVW